MRFSPSWSILCFDEAAMRLPKVIVPIMLALALNATPAAADVVVVVSSKSTITGLSRSQVIDIFLAKSVRYPDGSPAAPIDQIEGAKARDEFYASFSGKSAAQIKAYWSKIIFTGRGQPPKAVSNSVEIKKLLAQNPSAIGYIERSFADDSVRILTPP
jgi:ABC-type phosphate transport system substrate-binding protein